MESEMWERRVLHHGKLAWDKMGLELQDAVLTSPHARQAKEAQLMAEFFPEGARGSAAWRKMTENASGLAGMAEALAPETLASMAASRPTRDRFRRKQKRVIFLSHRHDDSKLAEDLAREIIRRSKFDVWLDVWDPTLQNLPQATLTAQQTALLIAHTIEMGLLNSDGVIALYTDKSQGSLWLPYEYGRIKKRSFYAKEAVAATRVPTSSLPEYMLLSGYYPHTANSNDIGRYNGLKGWLNSL